MRTFLVVTIAAAVLSGCVSVPPPLSGEYSATSPQQAREQGGSGQHVRWGGEIIRVDPGADATCFEVLGRELGDDARPYRRDAQQGRFLACRKGFFDPEVFTRGREITVTGVVDGSESRKVGDYDYLYPRVAADVVFLWPQRPRVERMYDPYPGFGFGPWGDPFWGGYWYPPTVVVVHGHGHGHSSPPPKSGH